ncbi:MAG: hypothetical protein Q9191_000265 [Dirinaria sp. TL-2023a]
MSLPTFNAKSPTIKRILKEAAELSANPDSTLHAAPLESNLFEWHFTLRGPPSTPYASGAYHGRIILPQQYPLRPPSFRFLTPSGRFEVNREICLSISGHHEETWQPAWGIRTSLWALRAFMEGGAKGQVGGMEMGEAERRRLAEESKGWKCNGCGGRTNEETLAAQEEEGGERQNTSKAEVPEELRFGFKDEMPKETKAEPSQTLRPANPSERATSAKSISAAAPLKVSEPDTQGQINRPYTASIPALSSTHNNLQPIAPQTHTQIPTITRASPQGAVPAWIDKAIVGLVFALLMMIIRKLAS